MNYFVGVDLGGTVVKASLFDEHGVQVATAGSRTPLVSDEIGQAERDIEDTRVRTYQVIRDAIERSGVSATRIVALAPTGHGKGLYTVRRDRSAGIGIVSTDTRSHEVAGRIRSAPDFGAEIYAKTFQPYWPAHTASILAWLKAARPEVYGEIGAILWAKDVVRWFLTDRIAAETTDISGSGLWNNTTDRVDDRLLRRLDIARIRDAIPAVISSLDRAGEVTTTAARATGLAAGTPVFAGLFDVNACALATGLVRSDELSATIGTWSISSFVGADLSRAIDADYPYVIQAHAVAGQQLVHEASPTSAGNLEWFVAHLLPDIAVDDRFAYCNRVVAETPDTDVTFFPFLFGSDSEARATGTLWGLRAGTDRDRIIRAVYEGIVFQHVRHMNRLLQVMDAPRVVRCAGGATRSEVWMQMFADALAVPVGVSPATELGTLGAAICAAVGIGAFDGFTDAIESMTSIRKTYQPRPGQSARLAAKQMRFDAAVEAMHPIWATHA